MTKQTSDRSPPLVICWAALTPSNRHMDYETGNSFRKGGKHECVTHEALSCDVGNLCDGFPDVGCRPRIGVHMV